MQEWTFLQVVPDAVPFVFVGTLSVIPWVWAWDLVAASVCTLRSVALFVRVSGTFHDFVLTSSPVKDLVLGF